MWAIYMLTQSDPDAFQATVAQVASGLLGFLGGFFVVRVQNYAQEWRELRLEIERLARIQAATMEALGGSRADDPGIDRLLERNEESIRSLAPLVHRRVNASIPLEIVIQLVVLIALTIFGVWQPLLMMSSPSELEKVKVLGPVVFLVMVSWLAMVTIAWLALRRLRAMPI